MLATASCGDQDAAPSPTLELLAGNIGGAGTLDGTATSARFDGPAAVALDSVGNLYVADLAAHTLRKITPAGVVTTLAGVGGMPGRTDGIGAIARFSVPTGVAVDSAGNVYVADWGNDAIRKVTPTGAVTTLAGGVMRGDADGKGTSAQFRSASSVAVDGAGNVYVADTLNSTIRKITPAGLVTTLAGTAGRVGSVDGVGAAARFSAPVGVAVDSAGNLYVTDGAIRKVTPDGVVTTLGVMLHFQPGAVAVDSASNLYVTDVANDIIDKITPEGLVTALAGTEGVAGSADGIGATASFNGPSGVAVDSAGDLYVADHDNHTIRVVTPTGNVTTLAGAVAMAGSADGLGVTARFNTPVGMAVDSTGNLYVADSNNATIREITPAGFVTTLAGAAGMVGNVDGTGAEARFFSPTAVAVDSTNNLYVTDGSNDSIRKVTPEGVVTTLAGAADMVGSADGTGAAARFSNPYGMAMDSAGNLYVADSGNNAIRMVTPDGVVTTLAGGMVGSTDGTGAAARFYGPGSMAMDTAGNLYVADYGNHTIRKVTPTGIVTTLAGAGIAGYVDGTGAAAQFRGPSDLAVDSSGNLYVADDSAIRKITPTGVTTTVAGAPGEIGIKLGAMPRFASPVGLAIAGDALIVSDTNAILLLRNVVR
jgi:hypothetical protein